MVKTIRGKIKVLNKKINKETNTFNEIREKYDIIRFTIDVKMMKRQFSIGYPQSISEVLLNFAFNMFYIMYII